MGEEKEGGRGNKVVLRYSSSLNENKERKQTSDAKPSNVPNRQLMQRLKQLTAP